MVKTHEGYDRIAGPRYSMDMIIHHSRGSLHGVNNINSLWLRDAIWRYRHGPTLAQVMACCLAAPSHCLNQCWLIISKVLGHSTEDIIIRRFEDTNQWRKIEDCIFKITLRFPRGQWVHSLSLRDAIWRYRHGPTLAHVMASCLTAPSHLPEPMLSKSSARSCDIHLTFGLLSGIWLWGSRSTAS